MLPRGIYAPLPAFFNDTDELDLDAYSAHAKYMATQGVVPVASASIGEAVHLDSEERMQIIRCLRSALDSIDLLQIPVVAGVGANSTRQTIQLARDAATAGAAFVLVVPPGYYAGVLKSHPTALRNFFLDVARGSPVPVIIYNYPGVAGGIDLDSDTVVNIADAANNICGIMLSCGNVGKLARISAAVESSAFRTFAGFIDFLLPSTLVGSAGAISPLPNLAPRFCMELWRLSQEIPMDFAEVRRLQGLAALGEASLLKYGVSGLKGLLSLKFGYPSTPRLPLLPATDNVVIQILNDQYVAQILGIENTL